MAPKLSLARLKALKSAFLKYQQKVHPDLFSGQGEKETWAKAWSGRVNDAFRVLEGELSRAEYLLSISDVVIGEADAVTDPELLMSIMETREELDDATTESEVSAIRLTNKDNAKETLGKLSEAFGKEPPDLDAARNLVIKLRYLQNVENVCREWSPGKRIELQH
ncbi:hypothetical protein RQP46_006786 [Phenoliferia psychrophenolica]